MKLRLYTSILASFILFGIADLTAQNCHNYYKHHCRQTHGEYKVDEQSKSALFVKGQTSELQLVVSAELEYIITICADAALGDNIDFKLKDAKTGETLYDNADDEYSNSYHYVPTYSHKHHIDIEVTVPKGEESDEYRGHPLEACIGILVEHRVRHKHGFKQGR